ncbi:MAG TPA: ADP-ribosylglycohydrolase family protein [Gemmatimonadales bacterium]
MTDTATALAGCLLGQALGDALGFVVEAKPPEIARQYVEDYLLAGRAGELAHPEFPFGQYSDDTQLARELVLSFVDGRGWNPELFGRRLAAIFAEGRDVGAGPATRAAAMRLLKGTHWTHSGTPAPYAGNGSAMRAAPLGVLFGTDDRALLRAAREQSLITHLDSRCAAGSLAVAGAVSLAVARYPVEDEQFLRAVADLAATADQSVATAILNLRGWSHLPPPEAARRLHAERLDPDYADAWRGVSAYVIPSVLWSLYAFVRTPDDYWTTLCTAIGVGGDTDTMAAIAGAISGARLGPGALPAPLVRRVHDRDGWGFEQLMDLARRAARLIEA